MIDPYMDLRNCNFGGATWRILGHMHPKLVTAKFIKWFYQWWASYFLKVTSYKLQLLGKKVTKLQLQLQIWKSN